MAKKSTFALKQLIPEENSKTGTKFIVRKPSKGLKASEKFLFQLIASLVVTLKLPSPV